MCQNTHMAKRHTEQFGACSRNRTYMTLRSEDFESSASTNSAMQASQICHNTIAPMQLQANCSSIHGIESHYGHSIEQSNGLALGVAGAISSMTKRSRIVARTSQIKVDCSIYNAMCHP